MAVYAIAIIPMILMIVDITSKIDNSTKTAAYADHVTDAGKVSKSWLIAKEKAKQRVFAVFKGTVIKITTEGQRHLEAVIVSSKY